MTRELELPAEPDGEWAAGVRRPRWRTARDQRIGMTARLFDRALWAEHAGVRKVARAGARRIVGRRLPDLVADYGDFRFRVPAKDETYWQIFLYGEYEPANSAFLRAWLRSGDVAVDVGANHGWFSFLAAAAIGPSGHVIAYEPQPVLAEAWRSNRALNPQLSVELAEMALSKAPGTVTIHTFPDLPHGHTSISTLGKDSYTQYNVRASSLDALVRREDNVTFVKLDVEGAELDVVQGATGLNASRRPPSWMVEVNHETSDAFGYAPVEIFRAFRVVHDFSVFRVHDGALAPELDAENAPHGATWLFVSQPDRWRLGELGEERSQLA